MGPRNNLRPPLLRLSRRCMVQCLLFFQPVLALTKYPDLSTNPQTAIHSYSKGESYSPNSSGGIRTPCSLPFSDWAYLFFGYGGTPSMVSSCPFPRLTRNERGNTKNKSTLINDSIMLFTSFNFFQIEIGVWGKAPFGTFRVVGRSFVAQYKRLKDLFSSPIVVRAGEQLTDMLFKLVQNPFFHPKKKRAFHP